MIASIDINQILQSIATIIAAIAAIVAALHANQAKNNTSTPNGETRNIGEVITDVAHVVEHDTTPPTTGAK